jgi:hypothetical protein
MPPIEPRRPAKTGKEESEGREEEALICSPRADAEDSPGEEGSDPPGVRNVTRRDQIQSMHCLNEIGSVQIICFSPQARFEGYLFIHPPPI